MGKIVLMCVLATGFGFAGAAGGVAVLHDSLRGAQGQTGLTGAPGPEGPGGQDGADGTDGTPGPRGLPGRTARTAPRRVDLGTGACVGRSVEVVTNATVTSAQRLKLTKRTICVTR